MSDRCPMGPIGPIAEDAHIFDRVWQDLCAILKAIMRHLPHCFQAGWFRLKEALCLHKKNTWWKAGGILFFVLLGTFLATKMVFAQVNIQLGWVDKLILVIAGYAMAVAGALTQGVIICLDLAIRLMMYNGFVTSPVVGAGWAIVRDAMNMFFVIILIVIAVMTIFGRTKVNWTQQVPKMLIFAIVINFSRTLCGIMIDISQVVMMTFANALRNVAAGNFIQMLGLNQIYLISQNSSTIKNVAQGGSAPVAFDWFAAGILSVFMVVMVLAVVLALVAILVWRIVTLWVLVTIAPLAWFMGGISGVFSQAKGYTEWWSKFICATAIGPVLTFFLWLTLAVAGAGSLAARGGFVSTTTQSNFNQSVSTNISAIFEPENLISFVLGMGMLFAGFEAATSICQGASPFVTKALGAAKGVGPAIAKQLQKLGKKAGTAGLKHTKAAGGAALGLGLRGARSVGTGVKTAGGWAGREVGERAAGTRGLGLFTKKGRAAAYRKVAGATRGQGFFGRQISKRADIWGEELERARMGETKELGTGVPEGSTSQTKMNQLKNLMGSKSKTSQMRARNLFMEFAATEDGRRQMSVAGITDDFWDKNGAELTETYKNDPEAKGKLDAFKKARVDLSGKKWTEAISSWSDVNALDPEAIEVLNTKYGPAFQAHLESIGSDKKGINAWQSLVGYKDGKGEEVKSSNINAKAILEGKSTARGIRFASASAQDLASVTDADLIANVNERGVGNAHVRQRLMDPKIGRRINGLGDGARGALVKEMGIDASAGTVKDSAAVSAALAANPHMLGLLDQDAMGVLLKDDDGVAAATAVATNDNQKQIIAAAKAEPGASEQLLGNYAHVLEAGANKDTSGRMRGRLNDFVTQWRGIHAKETTALKQAQIDLERAKEDLTGATQKRRENEQSTQEIQARIDDGSSPDEAADQQKLNDLNADLATFQSLVPRLEQQVRDLEAAHTTARSAMEDKTKPLVQSLEAQVQTLTGQVAARRSSVGFGVSDDELSRLQEEQRALEDRLNALKQQLIEG